jgi:hypothetical protein
MALRPELREKIGKHLNYLHNNTVELLSRPLSRKFVVSLSLKDVESQ